MLPLPVCPLPLPESASGAVEAVASGSVEAIASDAVEAFASDASGAAPFAGNSIAFRSGQSVTLGKNTITKTRTAYKKYLMSYPPYSLWNRERRAAMSVAEGEDIMNQA